MVDAFDFGKNWKSFLEKYLSDERIDEAKKSLEKFLKTDLRGKTFVDIGCGSGLFSLAAHRLGARKVLSFDVDEFSVECAKKLREKENSPDLWNVTEGSILDKSFISTLEKYDVVYSWGVLHHTGDMWKAIDNAANLVADKGLLYIAIYNKADGFGLYADGRIGSSKFWELEKRIYYKLPKLIQSVIDHIVMFLMIIMYLVAFRNPIKEIKGHKSFRGMSWKIDIKDWLGGYPYEYASVEEIFKFMHKRGFVLKNLISHNDLRNNEFLFYKK